MSTKPRINFIALLGGPGAGKGTQSALLTAHFASTSHLSVGAVLRAEAADPSSPHATTITENMRLGLVGPVTISVPVMKRHIELDIRDGVQTFLLDGFPRRMNQVDYFEEQVAPVSVVIVLDCADEVLVERIRARKRGDDDEASVRTRVAMFHTSTQEVIKHFANIGKVVRIAAEGTKEEVFDALVGALREAEEKGILAVPLVPKED